MNSVRTRKISRFRKTVGLVLVAGLSALLFAMLRWPSVRYGVARRIRAPVQRSVSFRVERIRKEKPRLAELAATAGGRMDVLVFKRERRVELHAPGWSDSLVYPMTGFSGTLGPKLREGDGQIPEGVYAVASLNPNSAFHLSLELGYPNENDRKRASNDGRTRLGGDIFLHGGRASIGCIPVGDDAIEDVFFLVAETGRENVRVVVSPYDMRAGRDPAFERAFSNASNVPAWYPELLDEIENALNSP